MKPAFGAAADWINNEYQRLVPLMRERKRDGFIRECHGDLHLENLAWVDGQLVIFDCIEFSAALRWIDIISEAAFCYMDLMHRHHRSGHTLHQCMAGKNRDYAGWHCCVITRCTALWYAPKWLRCVPDSPVVAMQRQIAPRSAPAVTGRTADAKNTGTTVDYARPVRFGQDHTHSIAAATTWHDPAALRCRTQAPDRSGCSET